VKNEINVKHQTKADKAGLMSMVSPMGIVARATWILLVLSLSFWVVSAKAVVHVFVTDSNGVPWIQYHCDAGETVRSFALDISVDRGQIIGVSNYFTGLSTATAQGYGVFPTSFRDHVTVSSGSNATWDAVGYSPLAAPADAPGGTLPGLGSSGVTLEFGAIWDPTVAAAMPPTRGTLCSLQLSQPAMVSVTPNAIRGGIIPSPADAAVTAAFAGALVGPAINGISRAGGTVTLLFQDGELETATSLSGPWIGTGNRTGIFIESLEAATMKFYRVHNH
jgi:hypothetical protein